MNSGTNRGFTLVEIMIVVPIIGLLAVIALPTIYSARVRSQTTVCLNNLRQVSAAKDQWAFENNLAEGTPTVADLQPYIKNEVACPAGGDYLPGDVSENVTCSAYDENSHPAEL